MDKLTYQFKADIICGECLVNHFVAEGSATRAALDMNVEDVLDQVAAYKGINRDDESSFDSWDFPKVEVACPQDHVCGTCLGLGFPRRDNL